MTVGYPVPRVLLPYTAGSNSTIQLTAAQQRAKQWFLADRTNGRAIGTVLRPSVVCSRRLSVRNVLWLNGAT